jgi:hypothetical protein
MSGSSRTADGSAASEPVLRGAALVLRVGRIDERAAEQQPHAGRARSRTSRAERSGARTVQPVHRAGSGPSLSVDP